MDLSLGVLCTECRSLSGSRHWLCFTSHSLSLGAKLQPCPVVPKLMCVAMPSVTLAQAPGTVWHGLSPAGLSCRAVSSSSDHPHRAHSEPSTLLLAQQWDSNSDRERYQQKMWEGTESISLLLAQLQLQLSKFLLFITSSTCGTEPCVPCLRNTIRYRLENPLVI